MLNVAKEITTPHQPEGPRFGNRVALPPTRRLTVGRDSRHCRDDILAEGLVQRRLTPRGNKAARCFSQDLRQCAVRCLDVTPHAAIPWDPRAWRGAPGAMRRPAPATPRRRR